MTKHIEIQYVKTDERLTYFILDHKTKTVYYFELCLN